MGEVCILVLLNFIDSASTGIYYYNYSTNRFPLPIVMNYDPVNVIVLGKPVTIINLVIVFVYSGTSLIRTP